MNQNENRVKYIKWTFLPVILVMCINSLVELVVTEGVAVYALSIFEGSTLKEFYALLVSLVLKPWFNGLIYIPYALISIALFGYYYKTLFNREMKFRFLKKSGNKFGTIGGILLFAIGMQYVTLYLVVAIASAFPKLFESYQILFESAGFNEYTSVVITLYALFLGPIAEELVFRGITFHAAKQYMSVPFAILIQAFLFGVFHKNIIQGIYAFVLGLGLGYIMYLYDDILLTILVHILFNLLGTYGSNYLPVGGNTLIGFFGWVLGSLIVTYCSLVILKKSQFDVNKQDDFTDI